MMGELSRRRLSVQEEEGYGSKAIQITKASASQKDSSGDRANAAAVIAAEEISLIPAGWHQSR